MHLGLELAACSTVVGGGVHLDSLSAQAEGVHRGYNVEAGEQLLLACIYCRCGGSGLLLISY